MKLAYSAHQFDKHQIKPLNDAVLVSDMTFDERFTTGGIVLLNDNGKVQASGHAGVRFMLWVLTNRMFKWVNGCAWRMVDGLAALM